MGYNINYFQKDLENLLKQTFENRMNQMRISDKDLLLIYYTQFDNFLIHVRKKSQSIYDYARRTEQESKVVRAATKDFMFSLEIFPNKEMLFSITFLQKTERLFSPKFLLSRIKDFTGYVYFLKSEFGYKIGCSRNLKTRLDHFSVLLPFKYEVNSIVKTKNYQEIEKILHKILREKRLNGEWFDLTSNDFNEIDKILENMSLKREAHGI